MSLPLEGPHVTVSAFDDLRVVVMMGTIPSRDASMAVGSLLRQLRKVDQIYVTLPQSSVWEGGKSGEVPPALHAAGASFS